MGLPGLNGSDLKLNGSDPRPPPVYSNSAAARAYVADDPDHGGGARWLKELRLVTGNLSTPSMPATVDESAPTRSSLTRQSGGARPRRRNDGGGNWGDG
jgi:hypothetical protein